MTNVARDRLDARRGAWLARFPGNTVSNRALELGFNDMKPGNQALMPHVKHAAEPAIRGQRTNINNLEPGYLVDNGTRDRVSLLTSATPVTQS